MLIARTNRLRDELGLAPRYDDRDFIVRTVLAWERRLQETPMVNR